MASRQRRWWRSCVDGKEAEHVKHEHVYLQADATLIEQLRAGYAEISALSSSGAKLIGSPFVASVADTPGTQGPPPAAAFSDCGGAPRTGTPVFDFRAPLCHSAPMETHAFGFHFRTTPRRAKSESPIGRANTGYSMRLAVRDTPLQRIGSSAHVPFTLDPETRRRPCSARGNEHGVRRQPEVCRAVQWLDV